MILLFLHDFNCYSIVYKILLSVSTPPPILIPVCVPFPSPEPLWDRLCCLKELELNCGNLMSCIECLVKYLVHNNHSITTG